MKFSAASFSDGEERERAASHVTRERGSCVGSERVLLFFPPRKRTRKPDEVTGVAADQSAFFAPRCRRDASLAAPLPTALRHGRRGSEQRQHRLLLASLNRLLRGTEPAPEALGGPICRPSPGRGPDPTDTAADPQQCRSATNA